MRKSKLTEYEKLWGSMSRAMKAAFRQICRRRRVFENKLPRQTLNALWRRKVIMTLADGRVLLNWRGAELYDYLKATKQVIKDKEMSE